MSTKEQLVLMALGSDRVGLVAQVSGYVRQRGGNVEDSRMAVLGSEFGMMILVSGSEEQMARIEAEKGNLSDFGLQAIVRRTKPPLHASPLRRAKVSAEALDHEGIVHALASTIERLGVNIASMETLCYQAPLSGAPLFRLEALLDLPSAIDIDVIQTSVGEVAESENLEVKVGYIEEAKGK